MWKSPKNPVSISACVRHKFWKNMLEANIYIKLSTVICVTMCLPMTVSDPSITLPLHYASPPPSTASTPSIFNIPLTEQSMEFPFYNSSKASQKFFYHFEKDHHVIVYDDFIMKIILWFINFWWILNIKRVSISRYQEIIPDTPYLVELSPESTLVILIKYQRI